MTDWTREPERRDEEQPAISGSGIPPQADEHLNTIAPLPGEPGIPDLSVRRARALSAKGLLAVGLLMASLIGVSAFSIERFTARGKKQDDGSTQRVSDRPAAATTEPRKLEVPSGKNASAGAAAGGGSPTSPHIPALVPTAAEFAEAAEPIGVHRTGQATTSSGRGTEISPEDAPVLLVSVRPSATPGNAGLPAHADISGNSGAATSNIASDSAPPEYPQTPADPLAATTRNLQQYQRQLQGMLDTLNHRGAPSLDELGGGGLASVVPAAGSGGVPSVLSGPPGTTSTAVMASLLHNRSLTIPKGTAFTCALKTKIISATSGPVGCQVQRNVYGDDGRVLLIERGSHLDGDYRIASVKPGTVRIPVVWTRLRTPQGVAVDIDSPGTGPLGEGGIDGYVDNRWVERIGAALLLSLINDSVQMVIQDQASSNSRNGQANTVLLPSTTANTNQLAEKVLESTINIPPLIYQNQGGIVGIVVAHDVDFSSVYALHPSALAPAAGQAALSDADQASGAAR
jgi:type IV secretion system protein VirB10